MIKEEIRNAYEKIDPTRQQKEKMLGEVMRRTMEKESQVERQGGFVFRKAVAMLAVVICMCCASGVVYAGYHWYQAKQVAAKLGDEKLARYFGKLEAEPVVQEVGDYRVAFLGTVSGKNISDQLMECDKKKTYAAVAVQRKDGEALTEDEDVVISPFLKGEDPMDFNIYTLNGGAVSTYLDGIYYSIADCSDLEMFADRGVYLGVMDGVVMRDAFDYDAKSGEIGIKEGYQGLHALFDLNLDESRADNQAAESFLAELAEKTEGELPEDVDETNIKDVLANCVYIEGSKKEVKPDAEGMIRYEDPDTGIDMIIHEGTVVEGENSYTVTEGDKDTFVYTFEKAGSKYYVRAYKLAK